MHCCSSILMSMLCFRTCRNNLLDPEGSTSVLCMLLIAIFRCSSILMSMLCFRTCMNWLLVQKGSSFVLCMLLFGINYYNNILSNTLRYCTCIRLKEYILAGRCFVLCMRLTARFHCSNIQYNTLHYCTCSLQAGYTRIRKYIVRCMCLTAMHCCSSILMSMLCFRTCRNNLLDPEGSTSVLCMLLIAIFRCSSILCCMFRFRTCMSMLLVSCRGRCFVLCIDLTARRYYNSNQSYMLRLHTYKNKLLVNYKDNMSAVARSLCSYKPHYSTILSNTLRYCTCIRLKEFLLQRKGFVLHNLLLAIRCRSSILNYIGFHRNCTEYKCFLGGNKDNLEDTNLLHLTHIMRCHILARIARSLKGKNCRFLLHCTLCRRSTLLRLKHSGLKQKEQKQ